MIYCISPSKRFILQQILSQDHDRVIHLVNNETKSHMIVSEDIVRLTIDGPEMLVEIVDLDKVAHCVWFNQHQELQKNSFEVKFLQLVRKGGKTR